MENNIDQLGNSSELDDLLRRYVLDGTDEESKKVREITGEYQMNKQMVAQPNPVKEQLLIQRLKNGPFLFKNGLGLVGVSAIVLGVLLAGGLTGLYLWGGENPEEEEAIQNKEENASLLSNNSKNEKNAYENKLTLNSTEESQNITSLTSFHMSNGSASQGGEEASEIWVEPNSNKVVIDSESSVVASDNPPTFGNPLINFSVEEVELLRKIQAGENAGMAIMELAVKRIPVNYPTEKYAMSGLFRFYDKENKDYVSLTEAAINIVDNGYNTNLENTDVKEGVFIEEVRSSFYKGSNIDRNKMKRMNFFLPMLLENHLHYPKGKGILGFHSKSVLNLYQNFDFVRSEDVTYNGFDCYLVETKGTWNYKFYVDKKTFAIHRIKLYGDGNKDPIHKSFESSNQFKVINVVEQDVCFKAGPNGKMYMKKHLISLEFTQMEQFTGKVIATNKLFQEMYIDEIKIDGNVTTNIPMDFNKNLSLQDEKYNEDYWNNLELIKNHPIKLEVKLSLSKGIVPLEKQFQSAGLVFEQ